MVGRDDECVRFSRWMGEANSGSARVVVVTGDAGIGKSALVSAVAAGTELSAVAVGRGPPQ